MLRVPKQKGITIWKKNRGFTLLEVVIVIAIMGILSMITLVSWSQSRTEKDVELAVREFQAIMRQAQGNAMVGKMDPNNPNNTPCEYRLLTVGNSAPYTQYKLAYKYKNGPTCSGGLQTLQTFTLPNGVVFSNKWSDDGLVFTLPTGSGTAANTSSIALTKGSVTRNICVPQDGRGGRNGSFSC